MHRVELLFRQWVCCCQLTPRIALVRNDLKSSAKKEVRDYPFDTAFEPKIIQTAQSEIFNSSSDAPSTTPIVHSLLLMSVVVDNRDST